MLKVFSLFVAAGCVFGNAAFAESLPNVRPGDAVVLTQQGTDVGIARIQPMEQIDIRASSLQNGMPVAVTGTLTGRDGANLVLTSDRVGSVLASIHQTGSPEVLFYARPIAAHVALGDPITVFGSIQRRADHLTVRTDAVYDAANNTVYFARENHELDASPLQRYAKSLKRQYRVL